MPTDPAANGRAVSRQVVPDATNVGFLVNRTIIQPNNSIYNCGPRGVVRPKSD